MKKKQKRKTPIPVPWQCRRSWGPLSARRSDDDWDWQCDARSAEEAATHFADQFMTADALLKPEGYHDWVQVRKYSETHTTRIASVKVTASLSVQWNADEEVEAAP